MAKVEHSPTTKPTVARRSREPYTPPNYSSFDWLLRANVPPGAVGPMAQIRKGVGSHMILAKQLARLSYRGRALAWEHCQAALPGCGAFARVNHGPVRE
jgi:hypothetical protein